MLIHQSFPSESHSHILMLQPLQVKYLPFQSLNWVKLHSLIKLFSISQSHCSSTLNFHSWVFQSLSLVFWLTVVYPHQWLRMMNLKKHSISRFKKTSFKVHHSLWIIISKVYWFLFLSHQNLTLISQSNSPIKVSNCIPT